MNGVGDTVPLVAYFQRLARDLGAEAVWPLVDGALGFVFAGPAGREHVVWSPWSGREGVACPPLEGRFLPHGLRGAALRERLAVISGVLRFPEERLDRDFCPLHFEPAPRGPILLDAGFVTRHLARFLAPGVTAWGPLLLRGVSELGADAVALRFESATGLVVVAVRAAAGAGADWVPAPPLALRLVTDTRSDQERRDVTQRVEDYAMYAMRRSFGPGQPVEVARSERPRPRRAPDDAAAHGVKFDRRDESARDGFFIDPDDRCLGHFEMFTTLLEADDGVSFVTYSRAECSHKLPFMKSASYVGSMWHRFSSLPWSMPRKPVEFIAPSEAELVLGTEGAVRSGIDRMARRDGLKLLVVNASCLCDYPGVDLQGVAAEATQGCRLPVVHTRSAMEQGSSIRDFWKELFQLVRTDVTPAVGTVNLVGFAPEDSPFAREVRAALETLGTRVLGLPVPSFRTQSTEQFLGAAVTVVSTDRLAQAEFEGVRESFPQMRYAEVAPPFGPTATAEFLAAVARLAGGEPPANAIEPLWAAHEPAWERWRRRAQDHEAAVLVRPCDAVYLADPSELYGLDLVRVLREMGFAVRLVCVAEEGATEPEERAAWTRQRLALHFAAERQGAGGLVIEEAPAAWSPAGLSRRVASASLVFSEFPPDARILGAGRMGFSPRDFELGLGGAVRTVARLVRLAENRFFRPAEPSAPEAP